MLEILTYLMWNFLIECFESVSQSIGFKLLIKEHFLELADHSIEDSSCDLYKSNGVKVRRDGDYRDVSRNQIGDKVCLYSLLDFQKQEGIVMLTWAGSISEVKASWMYGWRISSDSCT